MSEKKDTVCKLFCDRMRRVGRYDEFKQVIAAVAVETGQRHGQAKWEAMRRMGYVNPDDERRRHSQWMAAENAKEAETTDQATRDADHVVDRAQADFACCRDVLLGQELPL